MLKLKHNILFSLNGHNTSIGETIQSVMSQIGINPFIYFNNRDYSPSFFEAKTFCKDPFIYEPSYIESDKMVCSVGGDERHNLSNAIAFGAKHKCKYFCFIHTPLKLQKDFCEKSIEQIKDETIGTYTNLLDSGIEVYCHIMDGDINNGPILFLLDKYTKTFNHNSIGDFIRNLSIMGSFYRFNDFMAESQWINILLNQKLVSNKPQ